MTKAQLVAHVAQETGLNKEDVLKTIETCIVSIKNKLTEGEAIHLRGFGSFMLKTRAQKSARNILQNTTIIVPAHKIPAFKPSKQFIEQIKENTLVKEQ